MGLLFNTNLATARFFFASDSRMDRVPRSCIGLVAPVSAAPPGRTVCNYAGEVNAGWRLRLTRPTFPNRQGAPVVYRFCSPGKRSATGEDGAESEDLGRSFSSFPVRNSMRL